MFSQSDIIQIEGKGLDLQTVEQQLANFRLGFPFVQLSSAATPGNGISTIEDAEAHSLAEAYDQKIRGRGVMKFVPASGAASRMFKHLFEFREQLQTDPTMLDSLLEDKSFNSVAYFFEHLKEFAFYADLTNIPVEKRQRWGSNYLGVLNALLDEDGLAYANLPKGLLKFHRYGDGPSRSSLEEHLVEAALYATDNKKVASVHFTVSPEHLNKSHQRVEEVQEVYERRYNIRYNVSYSIQKPSTDVIAVDMNNQPFRESDGSLHFRPGGHGSLIENLNDLQGDIIFVKNIDNIVPDRLKGPGVLYKKALGALLLELQEKIFRILAVIEGSGLSQRRLSEIAYYCRQELSLCFPAHFQHMDIQTKVVMLRRLLNRPIRVCGMVKNVGEPGGGPFWVKGIDGNLSLQIIESSQVDFNNPEQKKIFGESTHFNPVDLVCGVRDYKGSFFNLPDFVDSGSGFISSKSKDGKMLKAQELPGLWNGAMAHWTTIFVETPLITFNPVKTINDLLRPEHLGE
ncbi:MAG: DUF4301 family protein [Bacteroidales bacterium]|nr:DUF4301 family protein [Bacteroidales bacterium]